MFSALSAITLFAEPVTINLWPGQAPGVTAVGPGEKDITTDKDELVAGRRVIRLGNVAQPTLTIFKPAPERDTGAAVVVCPGGGYHILAMDLEGTEVCEWLNSIGVTAALLKYRVPAAEGRPRHERPLMDVQRALGIVRARSTEFGIDPARVGVLGFSAGGNLCATLAQQTETRIYPGIDEADAQSCRPDFVVLVYPAWLVDAKQRDRVSELVAPHPGTPPTFLTMAEDDPLGVENVLHYYLALKNAGVPAELHLYPSGGHGYGLRRTENPVTTWPDRAADWMRASGWLPRK